jgi:hypothetical protein
MLLPNLAGLPRDPAIQREFSSGKRNDEAVNVCHVNLRVIRIED